MIKPDPVEYRVYNITPVGKPTMTQRDKWLNPPRAPVVMWRAFKNQCALERITFKPYGTSFVFVRPMPESWSDKKKAEYFQQPHEVKPDLSNMLKAIEDAVFKQDQVIFHYGSLYKLWGYKGQIWIKES